VRILKAKVHNFGSYKELEFEYNNQGLTLVYGPTGSGKSTLQDIPAWVIYGITAKDGSVDDIRNWSNLDEVTKGEITIELPSGDPVTITRIRSKSPGQNDLYLIYDSDGSARLNRGKDINDTQRIIEQIIKVTAEDYLTSAYFHEFSRTGAFFTAKAKERRELFNQLTDLSLAERLDSLSKIRLSGLRSESNINSSQLLAQQDVFRAIKSVFESNEKSKEEWQQNQEKTIKGLENKAKSYEEEREKKLATVYEELEYLELSLDINHKIECLKTELNAKLEQSKCRECGAPKDQKLIQSIRNEINKIETEYKVNLTKHNGLKNVLKDEQQKCNPYIAQLEAERVKENPFLRQARSSQQDIDKLSNKIKYLEEQIYVYKHKIDLTEQVRDLTVNLRSQLLQTSVQFVEDRTNDLIQDYFDGELRANFKLTGSDKLEVSLYKNGYECVYAQLSKGQRQILKLCFSLSVMKASANKIGQHFDTLMFDEALDGLDTELKLKAYKLFEALSLEHDSIIVIDHASELRSLFDNQYKVELVNDYSIIEKSS